MITPTTVPLVPVAGVSLLRHGKNSSWILALEFRPLRFLARLCICLTRSVVFTVRLFDGITAEIAEGVIAVLGQLLIILITAIAAFYQIVIISEFCFLRSVVQGDKRDSELIHFSRQLRQILCTAAYDR